MITERAMLIICVGIGLAVLLPLLIYASLRRQNTNQQIELLKRATTRSRQPWVNEDDNLQELSRLIAQLQNKPPDPPSHDKNSPE